MRDRTAGTVEPVVLGDSGVAEAADLAQEQRHALVFGEGLQAALQVEAFDLIGRRRHVGGARILDGADPAAVRVAPDVLRDAEHPPPPRARAARRPAPPSDHPQEHFARDITRDGRIARGQPVQEPPDGLAVPMEHPDGNLTGIGCWPHMRDQTHAEAKESHAAPRAVRPSRRRRNLRARLRAALHGKVDIMAGNRKLLRALFRYGGNPDHPLSWFGPATRRQREQSIGIFAEALRGERLPPDLRDSGPSLLWALHMGVLLAFLYDDSAGQRRTRRLIDAVVDLVVDMRRIVTSPLLRAARLLKSHRTRATAARGPCRMCADSSGDRTEAALKCRSLAPWGRRHRQDWECHDSTRAHVAHARPPPGLHLALTLFRGFLSPAALAQRTAATAAPACPTASIA